MPKTFTAAEISKHDTHEDCWIIVRKKVYDVTRFLDDHPGGGEVIVEQAGGDSTNAFEGVGHSEQAKKDLENYYIGDLSEEAGSATTAGAAASASAKKEESSGGFSKFLVPVVIAAIGGVLFFSRSNKLKQ
eukprot:TRINITY_DN311_c0_g1_i3.p1 TRINITY_DN311_c0_g1~~TRINITY_DN311_c0_g1_i3.p1  ORF type:complete len:131 (+),score=52.14 TRINITY_DN311_c0_g1_i3:69-461(+)